MPRQRLQRACATLALFALVTLLCGEAHAEQPIFDEMPRWNDGWGVQALHEFRTESSLLQGGATVDPELAESIHLLHLQGVYTFTKAFRVTLKIPVVLDATRELPGDAGGVRTEHTRGLGDVTIAVPLKSYFNLDGRSGSFTLAPQLRVPGGARDASSYSVFPQVFGNGLGMGYETETFRYHFGASVTGWSYYDDVPSDAFFDLSVGLNVNVAGLNGHVKWKTAVRAVTDGTYTLTMGPTIYMRLTDTWHVQLQLRHDLIDKQAALAHGEGDSVRTGVGVVF